MMRAMPALPAPRCTLEPLLEAHAPEMFDVLNDAALYTLEGAPPASVAHLAAVYRRLESRRSPDGSEAWLNWVVRLPGGAAAGYVQATVLAGGLAYIAYVIGSRHWRRGLGTAAVARMLDELVRAHGVQRFAAVLKARNEASHRLLQRLGFTPGTDAPPAGYEAGPDEIALARPAVLPPR
jgi:RimJ/RimL family protein N-acetyltransferase